MELKVDHSASGHIVYDADIIQQPDAGLFQPKYWFDQGAVRKTARGRGTAFMLDAPQGPWVLRVYRRGGWVASLSKDHYFFTGYASSRSIAETRMLAKMAKMNLPVPQPIAGICWKRGLFYRAALLTREITESVPLADRLNDMPSTHPGWQRIGSCIRRFHDAGVVHSDLNARNILLAESWDSPVPVHLIDFDKSFFRLNSHRLFQSNLKRLLRSLKKHWPKTNLNELGPCWDQLLKGYRVQTEID